MALAAQLIPGFKYRILKGMLADEVVTIVDNTPFPDGDPEGRQRKVTVAGPNGQTLYILPRLLSDRPVEDEPIPAAPVPVTPAPVVTAPAAPVVVSPEAPITVAGGQVITPITDPMDPRLDHLRPSRAKVRRYFKREMTNGMSDIDFLLTFASDEYRATNDGRPGNLMLKGETQSGKTFLIEALAVAWADKLGLPKPMPIFALNGSSGVTDFDLFGQTTSYTDENGVERLVWLTGQVELSSRVGGILYLNEPNAMGERVLPSLHSVVDHQHMFVNRNKPVYSGGQFIPEVVVTHQDLWVIATYNPADAGYRGMNDFSDSAFAQRFRHLVWDYDPEVERKLIGSDAVRLLGEYLRTARKAKQLRTPFGTSAMQRLEQDIQTFGIAMGVEIMLGMFTVNERGTVEQIVEDRSILIALQEEERQRRIDSRS